MNSQVSWKDYEGVEGFGSATQGDVDDLNKALSAGQDQNPPGSAVAGDGFSLRVEDFSATLKSTTYKMKHVQLWRDIFKSPAYNTVTEFNQIQSYGDNVDAGFIDEGDLPETSDSTYERKFNVVKYIGTTRSVTHVMSLVKPATGNVIARETVNGTMHLLRVLEKALFKGDSALNSLQFDGYEKLMLSDAPAANIIDMRGAPLSEDALVDGALTISDAPNYGTGTDFYCGPKTHSDLIKTFFPKERTQPGMLEGGMVGLNITGFTSPSGNVNFKPDVFIDDGGAPTAALGDVSKRPATPTISTGATTPVEATSLFAVDDAGSYFYEIQAVNRYGRSASVDVGGAIAIAAGDKLTFGVTPGSAVVVGWYELFRTKVGGADGTERLILRLPNTAGAGELTVDDINASLPGTTNGYLFEQTSENMEFLQLAPMLKIPLATIDTSIRWQQLLYGVPRLSTPGHNVLYTNIGRAAGFVGQP